MDDRISCSITKTSKHNALLNYYKLGNVLPEKTKPTERVGIAIKYTLYGIKRGVSFGDPIKMSDDPQTAMDFYRSACALGIRIGGV